MGRLLIAVRARRNRSGDADGFTLIEVIAAMVVFAIAASAIVSILVTTLRTSLNDRRRVVATSLAQQAVELARDQVKNAIYSTGTTTATQTVGGTDYTVTTTRAWTSVGQTGSACTGAVSGNVAYLRISANVTWANSTSTISSNAIATPLSPNAITIPVQIVDRNDSARSGVLVTLTSLDGSTTQSATTDSNGCAVFSQLTPAKYNINVNVAGYVDTTTVAATNHTEQDGLTIPGVTPVVVIPYDHPGTLQLSLSYTATFFAPNTLTYTVGQTGWTDTQSITTTSSSTPVNLTVFPFTVNTPGSGYSAYAGACSADQPTSIPSTTVGSPTASGTTTLSVPLQSVQFTFKTSFGTIQKSAVVTATDSCGSSYSWPAGAVTNSSTGLTKLALPVGVYVFKTKIGANASKTSGNTTITSATSSLNVTVA